MRILQWLTVLSFVSMVTCAILLPETPDKARIIDGLGKAVFVSFGLLVAVVVWRLHRWLRRPKAYETSMVLAGKPVVVDGSNVMHWNGDPSVKVLGRVLDELKNRGFQPLVYFDANVGYKLFDKHQSEAAMAAHLGLPANNVVHAPSRIPADEVLLERAVNDGLRVVTNDRFLDWKQRFPKVGEKGFLIKGMWKEGSVILLGLGRA